jgi:hypothetical protein
MINVRRPINVYLNVDDGMKRSHKDSVSWFLDIEAGVDESEDESEDGEDEDEIARGMFIM